MRQFNENIRYYLIMSIFYLLGSSMTAQTSCYFSSQTAGYPICYTFESGDIMHFSTGKNTNAKDLCPGSTGVDRSYRIQENSFILELKSASLDSISIYGKGSSDKERNFSKIEIAQSLEGPFTDITNQVQIGPSMRYLSCGRNLTAWNINAAQNSFVKFTVTLVSDLTTPANVNISELLLFSKDESTGVTDIYMSDKPVRYKKYYTILGEEVIENSEGLLIEKFFYEDGTTMSFKVLKIKP